MFSNGNFIKKFLSKFEDKQTKFINLLIERKYPEAQKLGYELYDSSPQFLFLVYYLTLDRSKTVLIELLKRNKNIDPFLVYALLKDKRVSYNEIREVLRDSGMESEIGRDRMESKVESNRIENSGIDSRVYNGINTYATGTNEPFIYYCIKREALMKRNDKNVRDLLEQVDDFVLYQYCIDNSIDPFREDKERESKERESKERESKERESKERESKESDNGRGNKESDQKESDQKESDQKDERNAPLGESSEPSEEHGSPHSLQSHDHSYSPNSPSSPKSSSLKNSINFKWYQVITTGNEDYGKEIIRSTKDFQIIQQVLNCTQIKTVEDPVYDLIIEYFRNGFSKGLITRGLAELRKSDKEKRESDKEKRESDKEKRESDKEKRESDKEKRESELRDKNDKKSELRDKNDKKSELRDKNDKKSELRDKSGNETKSNETNKHQNGHNDPSLLCLKALLMFLISTRTEKNLILALYLSRTYKFEENYEIALIHVFLNRFFGFSREVQRLLKELAVKNIQVYNLVYLWLDPLLVAYNEEIGKGRGSDRGKGSVERKGNNMKKGEKGNNIEKDKMNNIEKRNKTIQTNKTSTSNPFNNDSQKELYIKEGTDHLYRKTKENQQNLNKQTKKETEQDLKLAYNDLTMKLERDLKTIDLKLRKFIEEGLVHHTASLLKVREELSNHISIRELKERKFLAKNKETMFSQLLGPECSYLFEKLLWDHEREGDERSTSKRGTEEGRDSERNGNEMDKEGSGDEMDKEGNDNEIYSNENERMWEAIKSDYYGSSDDHCECECGKCSGTECNCTCHFACDCSGPCDCSEYCGCENGDYKEDSIGTLFERKLRPFNKAMFKNEHMEILDEEFIEEFMGRMIRRVRN